MVSIIDRRSAREALSLPFCYICGRLFDVEDNCDKDHIPPKALFLEEDRDFPLKLPTHANCNNQNSQADRFIGELVSMMHGKPPSDVVMSRFDIVKSPKAENPMLFVSSAQFKPQLWRWVRGFHSALYREFLPECNKWVVTAPFPEGLKEIDGIRVEPILPQHEKLVECLRINMLTKTYDEIALNNQKLQYVCTWEPDNMGNDVCVFSLRIYNWRELGDIHNFQPRDCVGAYWSPPGRPKQAARATRLEHPVRPSDKYTVFDNKP